MLNLNACNEEKIKMGKAKLKQLRLDLLKHNLIFIIVNRAIIFNMVVKKAPRPPQNNDIQHNDTQHNDTQHNDTQHNDIQHDTQHNSK
jgi:hypothetical protein